MVSDTQKKARNKWDAKNMSLLGCKVRKDKADQFKAACAAAGTTVNAVFVSAVDEFMRLHPVPADPDAVSEAAGNRGTGGGNGLNLPKPRYPRK